MPDTGLGRGLDTVAGQRRLRGPLFFPVTPFGHDGAVDPDVLAQHVRLGLAAKPGAVFVACGTGEFHALEPDEYREVVRTTVRTVREVAGEAGSGVGREAGNKARSGVGREAGNEAAGAVPVFAGAGGALPIARRFANAARDSGADGLLLMPPYLVDAPPRGLVDYTRAVATATDLPAIVYQRGGARFDPDGAAELAATVPQLVGFKDGLGDLEHLAAIIEAIGKALQGSGKPFQYFNGTPTAEASARAYRRIGVDLYSSAVFCFAPEISRAFHDALGAGDEATVERFLATFFRPLVELRDRVPGYAVALVKAGVRQAGLEVGGVRPPLVDPTPEHLERLRAITAAGLALCADLRQEARER